MQFLKYFKWDINYSICEKEHHMNRISALKKSIYERATDGNNLVTNYNKIKLLSV